MKINIATVVKVVETGDGRVVTVRVSRPWASNIWEDYSLLDNDREFKLDDEIEISVAHPVQPSTQDSIGKAGRVITAGGGK